MGRYAAPQVPRTLFDERRLLFAYTAGLFVGIVLLALWVLFVASLLLGGLLGALIFLAALLVVLELAQYLIGRSVYFGSDQALPFYVLSYRAGAAGLLGFGAVSEYLNGGSVSAAGLAGYFLVAVGFVLLLAAAGIQSTPTGPRDARRAGSVGRGVLLEIFGFLLLGLGPLGGPGGVLIAGVAVVGGSAGLYLRGREAVLGSIRAPREPSEDEPATPGRFGRRDRKGSG